MAQFIVYSFMQRRLVVDVKSSVIVLLLSSVLSVVSPNSDVPVTLLITLLKYAANLPNVEWSHINVFCLPRHFRLILITFKILVRPFWNVEFGLTDELKSEEKIFSCLLLGLHCHSLPKIFDAEHLSAVHHLAEWRYGDGEARRANG